MALTSSQGNADTDLERIVDIVGGREGAKMEKVVSTYILLSECRRIAGEKLLCSAKSVTSSASGSKSWRLMYVNYMKTALYKGRNQTQHCKIKYIINK